MLSTSCENAVKISPAVPRAKRVRLSDLSNDCRFLPSHASVQLSRSTAECSRKPLWMSVQNSPTKRFHSCECDAVRTFKQSSAIATNVASFCLASECHAPGASNMDISALDSVLSFRNLCRNLIESLDGDRRRDIGATVRNVLDRIPRVSQASLQAFALAIAADTVFQMSRIARGESLRRFTSASGLNNRDSSVVRDAARVGPHGFRIHPRVILALDVIRERFSDPALRLGDISAAVGLSAAYLDRVFKQSTGTSVSAHLRQVRVENAQRFLLDSNDSVKVIAFNAGFARAASFDRAFRRITKCTPTEWRARGVKPPWTLSAR